MADENTEVKPTVVPDADNTGQLALALADKDAEDNKGMTPPPVDTIDPAKEAEIKAAADKEAADKALADKAAEDAAKGDKPLDTEVWGSTGDAVGDSVLQMMQNAEMTTEDAKAILYDAVKAGDVTKIDRDKLVEKVGAAKATLILAGVENFVSKRTAAAAELQDIVHKAAGNKATWDDKVAPWVRANVPEAELNDIVDMLDAGGSKAQFAAAELIKRYNADPKNTSIGAETIRGDAAVDKSGGEAINKAEYADRLEKANRLTDPRAKANAIAQITAARRRGRAQGI